MTKTRLNRATMARKIRKLGVGAFIAAAPIALFVPAAAEAKEKPKVPVAAATNAEPLGTTTADFYAYRREYPLWLAPSAGTAADDLLRLLEDAALDGLNPANYGLDGLHQAVAEARNGSHKPNDKALVRADRLLSQAFVAYVNDVRRDPGGINYVDSSLRPTPRPSRFLLDDVARAKSPSAYIKSFAWANPIYVQLRSALAAKAYAQSEERDRIALNLQRARILPAGKQRYLMVNAAEQRLYIFEDGQAIDRMNVVVGKPKYATPMMVALVRFAALNPYWFVPPDLASERIAPNVIRRGPPYLEELGYEVMTDWSEDASIVDPKTVNWKKVAAGDEQVMIRQRPGPHNSMGRMKFMFPNEAGVYLHDNPERELFTEASRLYSGGCVRLEDAARLGQWLFGRPLEWEGAAPEQQVPLDRPVPVYITYLTAMPGPDGTIAFFDDVYSRDKAGLAAAETPAVTGNGR